MNKDNYFGNVAAQGSHKIAMKAAIRLTRISKTRGAIADRYEAMQPTVTINKRGEVQIESAAKARLPEIVGRYDASTLKGCDLDREIALAAMIAEDLEAHPYAPKMLEAA